MGKHMRNFKSYPVKMFIAVATAAVLSILCTSIISIVFDIHPMMAGAVMAAVFALTCAVGIIMYRFITLRKRGPAATDDGMSGLESNLTLTLMSELYMPLALADENERIVWYNQSFADIAEIKSSVFGKKFNDICSIPLSALKDSTKPMGTTTIAFDSFYAIKAYNIVFEKKEMTLTVWNNTTELERANSRLRQENPLVAFIVIDNLDELIQYAQESYRTASAEVEGILRNWADSINGIFREYERDKFIMVFQAKYLSEFISSKFEILDKIRNVRVGEGNLPVTVSIGISNIDGNLADKEKASRTALDTALQRGGDQVALKSDGGMDFYGGTVQTTQKRTKVRARVVAEEISHLITKSDNVIIMPHVYPDFDAIGSAIGMARMAAHCGTKANIVTNLNSAEFKKCYAKLEALPEYGQKEMFVDHTRAQELLGSNTLLIITDVNNPTQFEAPDLAKNARNIVVVDHHRKAPAFTYDAAVTYIEPAASSTCEMVAEMMEQVIPTGEISREEADVMLSGIMLDTKQFSKNTGPRTFSAALYLRNEGANPASASELFRTDLKDLVSEADFESNVVIYRREIAITQNSDTKNVTPQTRISAAKAADKLLNVEGVSASFVICQSDEAIHISARSNGKINVQLILETLGGGGHFDSAATRMTGVNITQALTKLKEAIDAYLTK